MRKKVRALRRSLLTAMNCIVAPMSLGAVAFLAVMLDPVSGAAADSRPTLAGRTPSLVIVVDGPSPMLESLEQAVRAAVDELTDVPAERITTSSGDWSAAGVSAQLRSALAEADAVVTLGVLSTLAAADPSLELPVPVVGGFVHDGALLGLDWDKFGRSTKENLAFVATRGRVRKDLDTFAELVDLSDVQVVLDPALREVVPDLSARLAAAVAGASYKVRMVDPQGLSTDDAEPVYIGLLPRMALSARQRLFAELAGQGLPVFALRGRRDVENGALAGLLPPSEERLARQLAEHLGAVLRGTDPTELPAYLPLQERLTINGRTAAEIGFELDLETRLVADVIHQEALDSGEPLLLSDAMHLALEANIDLQLQRDERDIAVAERKRAGSMLLPQLELGSTRTQIDEDRAASSGGLLAERETTVGLTATQLLFDDSAWTGYRAARASAISAGHEVAATQLDVADAAARAYLNWRRALALASIEIENLRLTMSNLETAQVRLQVGAAGREEVYRWGSEEAQQRASVLAALAAVEQARFALNQVLGVDQSSHWHSAAIESSGDLDQVDQRWRRVADVERQAELEAAVVVAALESSPSLRAFDASIEANEAVVGLRKRSFFVPSLIAAFSFDRVLNQEFAQSSQFPGPGADDDNWTFALTALLPVFQGGDRFHALGEAKAQLGLTQHAQEQARQLIEQQARSALAAVRSSYPSIELIRSAAEQSRLNLEIVQDQYAVGKASILDLVDAQRQTFALEQSASIAVYDYLEDLMALQRSISWFELLAPPDDVDRFFRRFEEGADHEQ